MSVCVDEWVKVPSTPGKAFKERSRGVFVALYRTDRGERSWKKGVRTLKRLIKPEEREKR